MLNPSDHLQSDGMSYLRKARTAAKLVRARFRRNTRRAIFASRTDLMQETLDEIRVTTDLLREFAVERRRADAVTLGNPVSAKGYGVFSQGDEDGITLEILNRIQPLSHVFVEIGVSGGTQCNTLVLLASGWRGVWCGNEELLFQSNGSRLTFNKAWITRQNVVGLVSDALRTQKASPDDVSVVACDIDGNDIHIVTDLLNSGLQPDLVIIEYNPLLPPPIKWARTYDDANRPHLSHYGASLQFIADRLGDLGYFLTACSLQNGNNAFFVHRSHREKFIDVTADIDEIYVGRGLKTFNFPVSGKPWDSRTITDLIN